MVERSTDKAQHVGPAVGKTLVCHLPFGPVSAWIRRRDRTWPVRHRVRGIGNVLHILRFTRTRHVERKRAVAMQIQIGGLCLFRRPRAISVPGVRSRLEGACLPLELVPCAVQIETKERSLNPLAELACGFVTSK